MITAALLSVLPAPPALAQPAVESHTQVEEPEQAPNHRRLLEEGENSWLYGDYGAVIHLLAPALFPEPQGEWNPDQLMQAYVLVGSSYFFLGERDAAQQAFHALLRLEPDYELDRLLYPATVVSFLNDTRVLYEEELDGIRQSRGQTPIEQPGGILYVERRIAERSWWVSTLPFGIGHFSNRQTGWGIAYLVSEVLLGASSIGMYLAGESLRDGDGYFEDADRAETYRTIQLVTGYSFFAVLLVNIVHGAIIHEGVIETSYRTVAEPPVADEGGALFSWFTAAILQEGGALFEIGCHW
ncbi:MAG: hypothetical protein JW797_17290 [Bradymonadales bacterium]|nr:hypothetical protein [Bradymonadales bacterium]